MAAPETPGWGEIALPVLLAAVLVAVVVALMRRRSQAARERRLLEQPLSPENVATLEKRFPRFRALPEELRAKLESYTNYLMNTKRFEACGGLSEVTEEMKVLISAQAALLLVGLEKHRFYPRLRSILVYPRAFRDRGRRRFGIPEEERGLLGESWETGSVILSWDSVVAGARNDDDGMNLVIHEFAHQLDQTDGAADGVPVLSNRDFHRRWADVFRKHYEELVEEVNDPKSPEPFLDPYGATHPAEFFAVVSEAFFEEPHDLEEMHPELYDQLLAFYGLDPAGWPEP
ncbi:MAG: M90 family metallopeptidase [Verrucomicrobiales bacterium]